MRRLESKSTVVLINCSTCGATVYLCQIRPASATPATICERTHQSIHVDGSTVKMAPLTPTALVRIMTLTRMTVPTRRFTIRGLRKRHLPRPSRTNMNRPSDDFATRIVIICEGSDNLWNGAPLWRKHDGDFSSIGRSQNLRGSLT